MNSRLEQAIEEIEQFIENCRMQPLSSTKIVVNKEELLELIAELKRNTPEEIKRYQKIINNKEEILADAKAKADQIVEQAQIHTTELVNEHQIMQQAYAEANEIVLQATKQAEGILNNATIDANNIRSGAIQYTDDMLHSIEGILSASIDTTRERSERLVSSLQEYFDIVSANRAELAPSEILQDEEPKGEEDDLEEDLSTVEIDNN